MRRRGAGLLPVRGQPWAGGAHSPRKHCCLRPQPSHRAGAVDGVCPRGRRAALTGPGQGTEERTTGNTKARPLEQGRKHRSDGNRLGPGCMWKVDGTCGVGCQRKKAPSVQRPLRRTKPAPGFQSWPLASCPAGAAPRFSTGDGTEEASAVCSPHKAGAPRPGTCSFPGHGHGRTQGSLPHAGPAGPLQAAHCGEGTRSRRKDRANSLVSQELRRAQRGKAALAAEP